MTNIFGKCAFWARPSFDKAFRPVESDTDRIHFLIEPVFQEVKVVK